MILFSSTRRLPHRWPPPVEEGDQNRLSCPFWACRHTVYTRLNAPGVYFKLDLVDQAFDTRSLLELFFHDYYFFFPSLNLFRYTCSIFTSIILQRLFKTPPWRPGVNSRPGVWSSKYVAFIPQKSPSPPAKAPSPTQMPNAKSITCFHLCCRDFLYCTSL